MKLVADKQAVSMLIGTLIAVIITVIFVVAVGNFVGGIVSNIPTVRGEIGDSTKVICFGGGEDNTIHCLEKTTGKELFSFEKAKKWDGPADSTPALTKDGIFFAIGNRICAYDVTGRAIWPENCKAFSGDISDLSTDEKYVCFGGGDDEIVHCLETKTGRIFADYYGSVEPYAKGPAISKPEIDGNYLYYGVGSALRKQDMTKASGTLEWERYRGNMIISTNLAINEKYICYGGTHDYWYRNVEGAHVFSHIYCYNKADGKEIFVSAENKKIFSTPVVKDDILYFAIWQDIFEYDLALGKSSVIYKEKIETKMDKSGKITQPRGISSDLELQEDSLCFGSTPKVDGIGKYACLDLSVENIDIFNRNNVILSVSASGDQDSYVANTKPYLSEDVLYFALGDKVCSYNVGLIEKKAPGSLNWCVDFDYMITTGIAGLPAEEES